MDPAFSRMEVLVGEDAMARLRRTSVLLVGVGGVGSWTAEALVRSGVGRLTIVDSDLVCVTNVNRQVQATFDTIGRPKVQALRDRLKAVYPRAQVEAIDAVYTPDTADSFDLNAYDFVLDAIDSVSCKVALIERALAADTVLYASMGAACKLDARRIAVGSFWSVTGCPLAKLVRKQLRARGVDRDFVCVYSPENRPQHPPKIACGSGNCACPAAAADAHEWCASKKRINGSAAHVTGIFGLHLAGLVVQHVVDGPPTD